MENIKKEKDNSIKNWWKKLTLKKKNIPKTECVEVFGVSLKDSLERARAAIVYSENDSQTVVGYVPIIVAKCGSFLKDQGLYTEGIFRMSGSAKRIGELQQLFNSPLDYGKQLDWKGYSVHDAANVLRRFLNYMPEPVIVHGLYDSFQDVIDTKSSDSEKIKAYQLLLEQLPNHNQHLLFYLLDLMALFSQNAQYTKMDLFNLSAVFTPGILLSPEHEMNPTHYKASQRVVQFLIEHHASFKMSKQCNHNLGPMPLTEVSDLNQPVATPLDSFSGILSGNLGAMHTYTKSSLSQGVISEMSPYHLMDEKNQHLLRANTVPAKRSRYGLHDPMQTIQVNRDAC
ncbi:Rho GTPase activation protein [Spinellus fusiger]|nr:Rho GTPase activation protein [Spinellus fusiger]